MEYHLIHHFITYDDFCRNEIVKELGIEEDELFLIYSLLEGHRYVLLDRQRV